MSDNPQTTGMPPPPPGYSASDITPAPQMQASSSMPPPPSGYSASDVVANPNAPPQPGASSNPKADFEKDQWGEGTTLGNVGEGFGKGLEQTLTGTDALARKYLPAVMTNSWLGMGKPANIGQEQAESTPHGMAQDVGNSLEGITEFIMGDLALKGIPYVTRLETALKATKVIQGSPRLAQAMSVGSKVLKLAALHGAEATAVQTGQTLAKTGDPEQAAKSGLETGATAGLIDAPVQALGEGLQKAGEVAGKVKNLADVAQNSKGTEEVAEELSNRVKASEVQRGNDFEAGINKIKGDLKGQTIERADSPVAVKAKELLANPIPEDDPLTTSAKNVSGDKLDANTKTLLQKAAMGGEPAATTGAPEGNKPLVLDANGKPVQSKTDLTPVAIKPHPPYTVDNLIQIRQAVRKAGADYEYSDPNAYALRQLNNSIDDTIEQMAQKSGNPQALTDYKALRAGYRTQIHAFDNPVIRNLRDGKFDDAAKAFVGLHNPNSSLPSGGKTNFNIQSLNDAIGPDGVQAFGKQVFGTMLKDSMDNGTINPAKFSQTWSRIADSTKGNLFNIQDAQNGIDQLVKDAQAGATLQHLTRTGVLGAGSVAAGAMGGLHLVGMGLATALGLVVSEGGGVAAGRDLLNKIAANPATWNAYERAGQAAAKGTGVTSKAIAGTANNALNPNNSPKKTTPSWAQSTQNSLSK